MELSEIAKKVRRDVIEMIYEAGSGHPGGSLSSTDLLVALYFGEVTDLEACPQRQSRSAGRGGRDKFILSAGHVCPAWYAVLSQKSHPEGIPQREQVKSQKLGDLRELGSELQGHPYKRMAEFVESSTGSLGQGISVGAGMALGKKLKKEKGPPASAFGPTALLRNAMRAGAADGGQGIVWVLSSDGEQEEGQTWEAAMFAAKRELNNLCLIIDRNGMQIGGETEKITKLEPLKEKYQAFGWEVLEIDGHDFKQILAAYKIAKKVRTAPLVIIAKTIRGKGVSFMENQVRYHACTLTEEEYKKALKELESN